MRNGQENERRILRHPLTLYAMLDTAGTEPADLDECRGHTDATRGYHYHVASAGENMFISCFHGEQGEREGGEGPPP